MNKIEELENQLMEERNKMHDNLKDKYKWVVGKYVKYNDSSEESFIMRIDNLCHIFMNATEDYYKNELESDDIIYVDVTSIHYNAKSNYYFLAKHNNVSIRMKDITNMPEGEFENLVERLFNEAKKNLL